MVGICWPSRHGLLPGQLEKDTPVVWSSSISAPRQYTQEAGRRVHSLPGYCRGKNVSGSCGFVACRTSPCIWKGVSATLQSGRYTFSYPMGRGAEPKQPARAKHKSPAVPLCMRHQDSLTRRSITRFPGLGVPVFTVRGSGIWLSFQSDMGYFFRSPLAFTHYSRTASLFSVDGIIDSMFVLAYLPPWCISFQLHSCIFSMCIRRKNKISVHKDDLSVSGASVRLFARHTIFFSVKNVVFVPSLTWS